MKGVTVSPILVMKRIFMLEASSHEFSIYRLEHKIEGFVLRSDPNLFVVKGQMLHIHAPRAFS
jgi:hypothetical protein